MKFYEVVEQVLDLLQRQGRVSYRALKREFGLDDDYLEDLKAEIIQVKKLAIDEGRAVLVWTGDRSYEAELYRLKGELSLKSRQVRSQRSPLKDK